MAVDWHKPGGSLTMRLTSAQQIPARVQRCAEKRQLGTPRILYEVGKSSHLHIVIGPIAIIIGALIISAYFLFYDSLFSWWPAEQAYLVLLVGVAWFGIACWVMLPPLIAPGVHVFLCPKGLIYIKRKMDVVRWDQITQFSKTIKLDGNARPTCSYNIWREDNTLFVLKDDLPYVDRLAGFLERGVTRQLLPRAIAAYENGIVLEFAGIAITTAGIMLKQDRKRLLWAEVKGIGVDEATVSIYRKGDQWDWATMSISGIPNVGVLKGLVEHNIQSPTQSPQIMAYDAGFSVSFGHLRISKAGVSVNNNEEVIPWNEIASFGIGETEVIIRRRGHIQEWYTLPTWQIPEIHALEKLVNYILFH
jgi:hypothetical protein